MATPNLIGGSLPWSSGGASMDFTGSPAGLANSYSNAYQSALGMNQQNYSNILAGYQQTAAAQNQAQQGVQGGYGQLSSDVLGGIQNAGQAQSQAIADAYTRQSGQAAQGLVSRGLGNTTVANSVQRGISLDQTKAQNDLAGQMAQLRAGYQSNIGLAGLNYGGQAAAQNTDQANRQLGWMNSVNAGYPDARLYGTLAQQYGQTQQANADRDRLYGTGGTMGGSMGGSGRGTTGYTPGGTGGATGRPTPGSFGPSGGGYGSSLGGGGATQAIPGNYLGTGTPQAVGEYDQYANGYDLSADDPSQQWGYDFSDNPAPWDQYAGGYQFDEPVYGDIG